MILKDLLDPHNTSPVTPLDQIGAGAQGEVFRIMKNANDPWDQVLKLYHASASSIQGKHLTGYARYAHQQHKLKASPTLPLPLRVVVDESQNRIGYTMRMIQGQPLDSTLYYDLYVHTAGLKARLFAAKILAETVATLHHHLIVSADIADANLHLDMKTMTIFHTDLDGGGVLISDLETKYLPGLSPLVRGHMEGSSMAPEMFQDQNKTASLASDRWSLAVMIHKLLFIGLDPYFARSTYQEVLEQKLVWPTLHTSDSARQKYVPFHLEELSRIGSIIKQHFTTVFNRAQNECHPDVRPEADDWARDLEIALEWVKTCQHCKQEFVAEGLQACPFCRKRFSIPLVWTYRACIPIDRQGKSILGSVLGFRDHQGRYIIAVFGRQHGKLFLRPRVPLFDLEKNQHYDPSNPIYLEPHKMETTILAHSSDGNQKNEFRIRIH